MDNQRIANIFHKFLNKKEIIDDGFLFEFESVKMIQSGLFRFYVNIVLPEKNWCYFKNDMIQRIQSILSQKITPIYGEPFMVELDLKINNKNPLNCFINSQKLDLILTKLNESFSTFESKNLKVNLRFGYLPKKYSSSESEIEFNFYVDIKNIVYKKRPVKVKNNGLTDVSAWFYDVLNIDSDLAMDVADQCFFLTQDQLKTLEDTVIVSYLRINTIDGVKVSTKAFDFTPSTEELERSFILKNV